MSLSSVTGWRREQGISSIRERMLGPIQQLIGPIKSQLQQYIESANGFIRRLH